MNVFKITVVLNKGCVLKSARAFIIFQTLERHGEIIRSERKLKTLKMKSLILNYRSMRDKRNEEVFIRILTELPRLTK